MNKPDEFDFLLQENEPDEDSSYDETEGLVAVQTSPQENESEGEVHVGEYDGNEVGEDIQIPIATTTIPEKLEISEKLRHLIEKRLAIYQEFEELDNERQTMLAGKDLSDEAKAELNRQRRELQKLPSGQEAQDLLFKMAAKLGEIAKKVKAGKSPTLDNAMAHAHKLASQQWKLCMTREKILARLIEAAEEFTASNHLFIIFNRLGLESSLLFAWNIYATALEAEHTRATKKRQTIHEQLAEMSRKKQGLLARLHRANEEEKEQRRKLNRADELFGNRINFLLRERNSIAPQMVKEFWAIYTKATPFLCQNKLVGLDAAILRAFIRYGMISQRECCLTPETVEYILKDCADYNANADYSMGAMNVLYADEYLLLTANGSYTPSIDEELELNLRHSPAWYADRHLRRLISTVYKETVYNETLVNLSEAISELHQRQASLEAEAADLIRNAPDYSKVNANLKQQIQNCKVTAGRYERIVTRIEEQLLPQQVEIRELTEEKIDNLEFKITPNYLAGKEAIAIHRVARLCAKLQDPFPPFALRDNFNLDTGQVNTREEVIKELQEIERRDRTIFKEPLIPVKKESHRTYLRYCPLILLSPGCGFMGYSWNPRTNTEVGRLVIPLYSPRPGLRERIIYNLLSDFRWDTSKASAGMDLLGSETLMAAYSTVRWEYRRKQKQSREKSAIYTEENDRQNFRRHYSLYLQSALDGGKKLFFKCHEAYVALVKYIPLPHGVDKLKR